MHSSEPPKVGRVAASEAVIYLIMLIVLVVRPRGLLGQEGLFE